MHNDLFGEGHDRSEVYAALQKDMKRDLRIVQIASFAATALLVSAAIQGVENGWPWFLGALWAMFMGLNYHVDTSNRNFMMHIIDWRQNEKQFPE